MSTDPGRLGLREAGLPAERREDRRGRRGRRGRRVRVPSSRCGHALELVLGTQAPPSGPAVLPVARPDSTGRSSAGVSFPLATTLIAGACRPAVRRETVSEHHPVTPITTHRDPPRAARPPRACLTKIFTEQDPAEKIPSADTGWNFTSSRITVGAFDPTPSPTRTPRGTSHWKSWDTASGSPAPPKGLCRERSVGVVVDP